MNGNKWAVMRFNKDINEIITAEQGKETTQ